MSKNLSPNSLDPEVRELDQKIRGFVKAGSFDQITQSVADFVARKIEQNQSKKKSKKR